MKKRNHVLEILICTALAFVVFLGYMTLAEGKGVFEIEDISGDRRHLNDFAFEGIAGDEYGQVHFVWQDGELQRDYYAGDANQVDDVLLQKKEGKNIFSQYFQQTESSYNVDHELQPVPAADAAIRSINALEDVKGELQTELSEELSYISYDSIEGTAADKLDIYLELDDYENRKAARFFTGLQKTGEEYYFLRVAYSDRSTQMHHRENLEDMGISAVEMEDAWYTILRTGPEIEGETALFRIPKAEMIHLDKRPFEELWDKDYTGVVYGTAEPLLTFSVDRENRIAGMEKVGEDKLLLARSENDILYMELYDTEGNLLDRTEAGVEGFADCEIDTVQRIERENQLVIWFTVSETDPESDEYRVVARCCFNVEDDTITPIPLNEKEHSRYVDVQNGKVLTMSSISSSLQMDAIRTYAVGETGYYIRVDDLATGERLYHGRLQTDFEEDIDKFYSVFNIGQRLTPVYERTETTDEEWEKRAKLEKSVRTFRRILPVEGWYAQNSWEGSSYWNNWHSSYYSY